MATTRIKDLTESLTLQSDMYLAVDNEEGTKKVLAANLVDESLTESGKFADAAAVGDALSEKVPKETGKGLSTEDFTTAEKTKLSGIEAGATNTVIDDTLTETGQAADAKATGDEIADLKVAYEQIETDKADTNGTYPDMTVGMAQQLDSDVYTEDSEPYHFRRSGGGSVRVGEREVDEVVGGTLAWNQQMPLDSASWTVLGVSFTALNGRIAVSGQATTTTSGTTIFPSSIYNAIKPIYGHKYLLYYNGSRTFGTFSFNIYGDTSQTVSSVSSSRIFSCTVQNSTDAEFVVSLVAGTTYTADFTTQLIDLTAAFGSTIADYIYQLETATAGAGVAFLRRYIDIDTYHPYDAGTLKSVEGLVSHDMIGFNQWNEEWEPGSYAVDSITKVDATRIRTKNIIPVLPSTTYYAKCPTSLGCRFVDANGDYISSATPSNNEFVTPSNAHGLLFSVVNITTYNHDICINLSDPARNGQYEPYEHHSYPLDSTVTLRGVPKLVDGMLQYDGDRYSADGTVTRRYGVTVVNGDSDITAGTSGMPFKTLITGKKRLTATTDLPNGASDKLVGVTQASTWGVPYTFAFTNNTDYLFFKLADSVTTIEDAKTWLAANPITLIYELATPTTEEATPYTNPQWVDGSGTEQYVSTSPVPIGHYTQYPEDLKAKIEGLPWDFASLIAPTEATYKATRNYTTGSLFIVNNILYKATAAIANGGTITPNTNCTATTLAAVIAAL